MLFYNLILNYSLYKNLIYNLYYINIVLTFFAFGCSMVSTKCLHEKERGICVVTKCDEYIKYIINILFYKVFHPMIIKKFIL